jgi:CRP-like cAMP-binding protein
MTVADRVALLRDVAIFADVGQRDLALLASMTEIERFRAGEVLWEAGEVADRVYVVVVGALSVHLRGHERPVETVGPGGIVGELAMFAQSRRSAAVAADVDTTVLSLQHQPFREFLLAHPEALLALLGRIVRRFLDREREWTKP